jgi:hypothetical protein
MRYREVRPARRIHLDCHARRQSLAFTNNEDSSSGRFGPGTARHRTAFVAVLLALSRRDAETLALVGSPNPENS